VLCGCSCQERLLITSLFDVSSVFLNVYRYLYDTVILQVRLRVFSRKKSTVDTGTHVQEILHLE